MIIDRKNMFLLKLSQNIAQLDDDARQQALDAVQEDVRSIVKATVAALRYNVK